MINIKEQIIDLNNTIHQYRDEIKTKMHNLICNISNNKELNNDIKLFDDLVESKVEDYKEWKNKLQKINHKIDYIYDYNIKEEIKTFDLSDKYVITAVLSINKKKDMHPEHYIYIDNYSNLLFEFTIDPGYKNIKYYVYFIINYQPNSLYSYYLTGDVKKTKYMVQENIFIDRYYLQNEDSIKKYISIFNPHNHVGDYNYVYKHMINVSNYMFFIADFNLIQEENKRLKEELEKNKYPKDNNIIDLLS